MNCPPEWVPGSKWQRDHRGSLERIFVALRRECLQTFEIDQGLHATISIEQFANFVEVHDNRTDGESGLQQKGIGVRERVKAWPPARTPSHANSK